MNKLNKKDLVIYVLIAVILIIGLFYLFPKKNIKTTGTNSVVATTTTKTSTKTTGTKTVSPVATNVMNKCNFKVTSPEINSRVTVPFTVYGLLNNADKSEGCMWASNGDLAGNAEIFYNKDNQGWKSSGTSVPIVIKGIPGGATSTLSFSVPFTLYAAALGLKSGTPIKIVFTEFNIPVQATPDTFNFQVYLK